MVSRLTRVWADVSADDRRAGLAWYDRASAAADDIADRYGLDRSQAAGIIAAMSPRSRWSTNLRAAETIARAAADGAPSAPRVGLGDAVDKAWRIAHGEPAGLTLGGPKVRAFWRNITGDRDAVTVDVWAARAATGRYDAPVPAGRRYARIAAAYRAAAHAVGVAPRDFQAAVWVHVRGAAE